MDKDKFKQLTAHLIKYSPQLERDVLLPTTTPQACAHCPKQVIGQRVICEPHKLGRAQQHFKHKCLSCRMIVYDGSFVKEPRTLRPFSNYIPKTPPPLEKGADGRKISKNGKVMGRPRKDAVRDPKPPKRAVGRPRKTPQ